MAFVAGIGFACVAVALFVYCAPFVLDASDTGWLVRSGEYILQHRALPAHDIFSWTAGNRPWVLYQWLFEVVVGATFAAGKLYAVGATIYLLAGLIYFYFLPSDWLSRKVPPWLLALNQCLILTPTLFFARPQIASYLLILAFQAVLRKPSGSTAKWWLVPLMVLWVNTHSFWFIGLLMLLCEFFGRRQDKKQLAVLLVLCVLSVLINPYGFGLVQYNLSFLSEPDFKNIGELAGLFNGFEPLYAAFTAYLVINWLAMIWWRIKARTAITSASVDLGSLLFAVIATVAAIRFARFSTVAVLATWPCFGLMWSSVFNRRKQLSVESQQPGNVSPKLRAALLVFAILVPLVSWQLRVPGELEAARVFTNNDLEGVEFIAVHRLQKDRLFNDQPIGSRLILFGSVPVFIDNRFDMYGKQFCDNWQKLVWGDPSWKQQFDALNIQSVACSVNSGIYTSLFNAADWLLVYQDAQVSYWLRDTPEHRKALAHWGLTAENPAGFQSLSADTRARTLRAINARKQHASGYTVYR